MKKLKNKAGFTLMEMLVSIFVLVLLVMGIGTSMDSGLQVYKTSNLNANSGILADIINTSLDDFLRYAEVQIVENTSSTDDVDSSEKKTPVHSFVMKENEGNQKFEAVEEKLLFTSRDFGMVGAQFVLDADGILKIKGRVPSPTLDNPSPTAPVMELVNGGSYSDLKITQFSITYVPKGSNLTLYLTKNGTYTSTYTSTEGGFFFVDYKIENQLDKMQVRSVQTVVRLLNAE